MNNKLPERVELFEDQPVRAAWIESEEEWYFSVVDIVGVLTESKDPTAYWRKLKQRLKNEGNETVTNFHGLKMTAADGKMRLTDVASTEQACYNIERCSAAQRSCEHHDRIRC